jgi:hypothetical protein
MKDNVNTEHINTAVAKDWSGMFVDCHIQYGGKCMWIVTVFEDSTLECCIM